MQITLKYFGLIADFTKKKTELFSFEGDSVTLLEVQSRLHEIYPELKSTNYSIAMNQKLVQGNPTTKDLDEIALLPPFAGG
jgi:molybdopterin synthase sulfur carrier subunit